MISQVRLINYKKFLCEKISLEPMVVFIGPNGSGKSTVASALYVIATIIRLGLKSAFPEGFYSFDNIRNYDADKLGYRFAPIGLGISGNIADFSFDYDIVFSRDKESPSDYFINYEGLKIKSHDFKCHYSIGDHPKLPFQLPTKGETKWIENFEKALHRDSLFTTIEKAKIDKDLYSYLIEIKKYLQRMAKYQFSPSTTGRVHEQYDGSGQQPFLRNDGGNLAEVVQYLQEEQTGLLRQFKKLVIDYAEDGSKIIDVGVAVYEDKVFLRFYEEGKNRKTFEVRGPLLADGYWVFASFACLASAQILPTTAFFEEPESYLHPHKLPLLYNIFESMVMRKEEPCQVLISSHSPYFIDLFKNQPNAVIFLNNGKAKKLSEIDDYEKILSLYTLGEAWYSNVFSWGNP